MLLTPDQVQIEALSLPPESRAELADRLLASLSSDESDAVQQEWLALARRRLADVRNGTADELDGTEVMSTARRLVGK
jgi:hypothetical protein